MCTNTYLYGPWVRRNSIIQHQYHHHGHPILNIIIISFPAASSAAWWAAAWWATTWWAAYWARSRKLWSERRRPPLASHPRRLLMMMDDDDDGSSVSPILWLWLEEEEDGSVRTCRGSYAITSLIVSSAPKLFVKICIFRKQFSQTA